MSEEILKVTDTHTQTELLAELNTLQFKGSLEKSLKYLKRVLERELERAQKELKRGRALKVHTCGGVEVEDVGGVGRQLGRQFTSQETSMNLAQTSLSPTPTPSPNML